MIKLRTLLSLLVLLAATPDLAGAADVLEVIAADAAPADAVKVDISKMKYVPATLEIAEGTVVTWTNHDALPHNVQIGNPVAVMGDMLRAGQSLSIRFNAAGEYSYICTPHPYMKGKVTVKSKS